jgi:hypothetical protein
MAAIQFPTNPAYNDTHQVGNVTYTWDGSAWVGIGPSTVRLADLNDFATKEDITSTVIALG